MRYTITAAAVLTLSTGAALADYPERGITMIVAWAAGGGTDAIARTVAAGLEEELGVNVTVVNRDGGSGVIGHTAMVNADADGYTIGFASADLLGYYWTGNADLTAKEVTPIGLVNVDPGAFHVSTSSGWQDANAALEVIRNSERGEYKMSGSSVGGAFHLAFAGFLQSQGIDPLQVTMVPSQGAAPGFQSLAAGGVQIINSSLPEGQAMMQAGRSVPLAVFADERVATFPDVPTVAEATGTPFSGGNFRGVVGPAGMDEAVVARLEDAVEAVYNSDNFQSFMAKQGYGARYMAGGEFGEFLTQTQQSFGETLQAIGLAQRTE
ncbi:Bug family tripartite tricarboxylate transporter substrate binding protein [Limimaricola cinnabarinus]|uniref:Tricarboxylate transport protein TctC n=1 Tax=Limimaricola cinnabarinus LL-001 TaxID=1337093 RepID=U3AS49_9RHOB|nr:tripartite tricarboxylate transporter substrate binding protein [Limimaricola cinnabarinus]GAD57563.1 tricarboxylate transport protein TctC [Limimaricola cinnabarinus LL-001]